MKVLRWVLLALAPAVLMGWGWYLGQLHQSGYDVAGIFLFLAGAAGLVLALMTRLALKRYDWMGKWWVHLVTGILSCGVVFGVVLLAANLHK